MTPGADIRTLRFVLGDQLTRDGPALRDLDRARDVVLMVEAREECTHVRHHPQKIALILSAMRHFAQTLRGEGITVDYVALDDPDNTHGFRDELVRAARRHAPERVVVTEPGEWRVQADMETWAQAARVPVDILEDDRFLISRADFVGWAEGRKLILMEHFYRLMRRRTGYLMEGDAPAGGDWNLDKLNREPIPDRVDAPDPFHVKPDAITRDVLALVDDWFGDHFGRLDGFGWGVTDRDAQAALDWFVAHALAGFGTYQDAMRRGDPTLFHSVLSPYLNCGLLSPKQVCDAVEAEYRAGRVPLNAAEGFIRQVIGWREFVRGVYWWRMPDYAATNFLGADRPLPRFYWTADSGMECLDQAIGQTRDRAYAHHIQRLMVTGNFGLILGVAPAELEEWYLIVYADAYDWVELSNVHGMVLHADGGLLATKPYASGGKYINRMSDYCGACAYAVSRTTGEGACPFNSLYWHFLDRNRERLKDNRRLKMPYATWDRMDADKRRAILDQAAHYREEFTQ